MPGDLVIGQETQSSSPRAVRGPEPRCSLRHAGIVALAAALSHAWVLTLPFQLDDYSQVAAAPIRFGLSKPPVWDPVSAADAANETAAPEYLFRPVPWLAWLGLLQLGGPPISPLLFHAASL